MVYEEASKEGQVLLRTAAFLVQRDQFPCYTYCLYLVIKAFQ